MKFSQKLPLILLVTSVLPILLLSGLVYPQNRAFLLDAALYDLTRDLSNRQQVIARTVERNIEELTLFSSRATVLVAYNNYLKTEDLTELNAILSFLPESYKRVTVLDAGFNVVTSSDGVGLSEECLEICFVEDSLLHMSLDVNSEGEYLYYMSAPLVISGEIEGYIAVEAFAEDILSIVSEVTYTSDTRETYIIATEDPARFITPLRFKNGYKRFGDLDEKAIESYEGTASGLDYTGKASLISYVPINPVNWILVEKIHQEEALEPIDTILIELFSVALALAFVTVSVSVFLSKSLANPLQSLRDTVLEFSSGNLNRRVLVKNKKDEIGELAQAFNKMAGELDTLYKGLEEKVQERTQELEKFRLAAENSSEQIMMMDLHGTIAYANPAIKSMMDYSTDEVIGKTITKILGDSMGKAYYIKLFNTIRKTKKAFTGEIVSKKKSGEEFTASFYLVPIIDKSREVSFFVAVMTDITKAKAIDRMKTEFISIASHQLRTPLAAIRWSAELLTSGDVGKVSKDAMVYADAIHSSSIRMAGLVTALLNISRIESGRLIIEPKPTNVAKLLEGVLSDVRLRLKAKKQEVHLDIADDIGLISMDPTLVMHIYMNLITNAIKYTPEGGEIFLRVLIKGGDLLSSVHDTGMGIPKSQQKYIFKRFYRASNVISKVPEGTGLGLYLTKLIAETSGGKIWFESEENRGTTFWFTLPAAGMKARKGEVSLS